MPWAPQTCTRLLSVPLPFLLFTTKHGGSRSRKGGTCFFKSHLIASSTFTNQSKDKHGEGFMARRLWQGTDRKEMLRWLKGKSGCGWLSRHTCLIQDRWVHAMDTDKPSPSSPHQEAHAPADGQMRVLSHSVMSNSLWSQGLKPTSLLCPWNSPGKNTGVGWHSLLQGISPTQGLNTGPLHLLHWQMASLPLTPPGRTWSLAKLMSLEGRCTRN